MDQRIRELGRGIATGDDPAAAERALERLGDEGRDELMTLRCARGDHCWHHRTTQLMPPISSHLVWTSICCWCGMRSERTTIHRVDHHGDNLAAVAAKGFAFNGYRFKQSKPEQGSLF